MPGETLAVCGDQENPDWDQQAADAMAALVNGAVQTETTPVVVVAPAPTNS